MKLVENHTFVAKSFGIGMYNVGLVLLFIPLTILMMSMWIFYIPTGLLWFISLGHLHLFNLVTYFYEWFFNQNLEFKK